MCLSVSGLFNHVVFTSFVAVFVMNIMFACHPVTKILPRVSIITLACSKTDWACLLVFPHRPPQRAAAAADHREEWGGEAERHLACKKTICVEHECGHREMICLWSCLGLCESVGGRVYFVRTVVDLCASAMVYTCGCVLFFHRLSLVLLLSLW